MEGNLRCGLQLEDAHDPYALFTKWMDDAKVSELNDPNAMSLATCTPDGTPSLRVVLLKGFDAQGFKFYTNAESHKGRELRTNPRAALCFHWKSRQREVRVEGSVVELPAADADAYFKRRARMSQIGAWASQQSRPLGSREELMALTADYEKKFPGEVPRPDYWRGFMVVPQTIEFWQECDFRLHDRFLFTLSGEREWTRQRLFP